MNRPARKASTPGGETLADRRRQCAAIQRRMPLGNAPKWQPPTPRVASTAVYARPGND